jgi:serine O-acetyltransferase
MKFKGVIRYLREILMLIFICDVPFNHIWRCIKREIFFPHPVGVVVGGNVKIGRGCQIHQNVTIGNKGKGNTPILGKNVKIYANSVIIGKINIGDNVIIGASTFVNKDVPSNKTIVDKHEIKEI